MDLLQALSDVVQEWSHNGAITSIGVIFLWHNINGNPKTRKRKQSKNNKEQKLLLHSYY